MQSASRVKSAQTCSDACMAHLHSHHLQLLLICRGTLCRRRLWQPSAVREGQRSRWCWQLPAPDSPDPQALYCLPMGVLWELTGHLLPDFSSITWLYRTRFLLPFTIEVSSFHCMITSLTLDAGCHARLQAIKHPVCKSFN